MKPANFAKVCVLLVAMAAVPGCSKNDEHEPVTDFYDDLYDLYRLCGQVDLPPRSVFILDLYQRNPPDAMSRQTYRALLVHARERDEGFLATRREALAELASDPGLASEELREAVGGSPDDAEDRIEERIRILTAQVANTEKQLAVTDCVIDRL